MLVQIYTAFLFFFRVCFYCRVLQLVYGFCVVRSRPGSKVFIKPATELDEEDRVRVCPLYLLDGCVLTIPRIR